MTCPSAAQTTAIIHKPDLWFDAGYKTRPGEVPKATTVCRGVPYLPYTSDLTLTSSVRGYYRTGAKCVEEFNNAMRQLIHNEAHLMDSSVSALWIVLWIDGCRRLSLENGGEESALIGFNITSLQLIQIPVNCPPLTNAVQERHAIEGQNRARDWLDDGYRRIDRATLCR